MNTVQPINVLNPHANKQENNTKGNLKGRRVSKPSDKRSTLTPASPFLEASKNKSPSSSPLSQQRRLSPSSTSKRRSGGPLSRNMENDGKANGTAHTVTKQAARLGNCNASYDTETHIFEATGHRVKITVTKDHILQLKEYRGLAGHGLAGIKIHNCTFTQEAIQAICQFKNLTLLDLQHCGVTQDTNFTWLASLTHLKTLSLAHWQKVHFDPSTMGKLTELEELDISNVKATSDVFNVVFCPNLKTLKVGNIKDERLQSQLQDIQLAHNLTIEYEKASSPVHEVAKQLEKFSLNADPSDSSSSSHAAPPQIPPKVPPQAATTLVPSLSLQTTASSTEEPPQQAKSNVQIVVSEASLPEKSAETIEKPENKTESLQAETKEQTPVTQNTKKNEKDGCCVVM